ncbi:hypothetical protein [Mesorhizobium sp. YM1C-6-2]|uniref:hypothetical protein n=1 Tax=Mesorhizobium sp. YM1C-6-2 TaxID=1827501 RepID=UPI000EF1EBB1|nr:hypothetical protein [Mesorhizobium sp. YM1C-6-2]RLP24708.1 hypothetical protein D8676_14475 [Mesorhizobium sp. YM1C-6-2]
MTATNRKSGFFRSLLDAIVEARQREANRYVNGVLLAFDDDTLLRYGYSRAELSKRPNSIRTYL